MDDKTDREFTNCKLVLTNGEKISLDGLSCSYTETELQNAHYVPKVSGIEKMYVILKANNPLRVCKSPNRFFVIDNKLIPTTSVLYFEFE
jgi:hypothetical protein